jgi:hypothetical protein
MWPMPSATRRMASNRREYGFGGFRPHAEDGLALVGDVERIDSEQLAGRPHRVGDWQRKLVHDHADATLFRHLV